MLSLLSRRAHSLAFRRCCLALGACRCCSPANPRAPFTVEPTVPRPLTPTLASSRSFEQMNSSRIRLDAVRVARRLPAAVVEDRAGSRPDFARAHQFGGGTCASSCTTTSATVSWILYMGAPQIHAGMTVWRVERDLTDYTNAVPRSGRVVHRSQSRLGQRESFVRRGFGAWQRAPAVLSPRRRGARAARSGWRVRAGPAADVPAATSSRPTSTCSRKAWTSRPCPTTAIASGTRACPPRRSRRIRRCAISSRSATIGARR